MFASKVKEYIRAHQLLQSNGHYLVAVSGGADSVALFCLLHQLGYQVEICHCNFLLRGRESYRDEDCVRKLAERFDVPFHLIHFDTKSYAQLHKLSIEMAARELRYQYFEQLCSDLGCSAVCVAHHSDDNAETILLNLLRGSGVHGLCGIQPSRAIRQGSHIQVVRPLLCVSKTEIEKWLNEIGQNYITDSSNMIADVMRNRIRLNVMPQLRELVPSVADNLQTTAQLMIETSKIYDQYIASTVDRIVVNNKLCISELRGTISPISILHGWLSNYGFSSSMIRQINGHLDAETGRVWSSESHELCIDRGKLILTDRQNSIPPFKIPETGLYHITSQLHLRVEHAKEIVVDRSPDTACLDAAKVRFPIIIREVQEGDRFVPFGMNGSKLLSDFLTDLKIPLTQKRRQLVVTDAEGAIIWVVGLRISQLFAITSDTRFMLKLTVET